VKRAASESSKARAAAGRKRVARRSSAARGGASNSRASSSGTSSSGTSSSGTSPRKSATPRKSAARAARAGTRGGSVGDLRAYVRKRDFERTPEPKGASRARAAAPRGGGMFCIQKHDASRLHYDFRLELDGVLKSWAVPKGPSLDPHDRRLAVHVEDHPLDYGEFEGVIPEKAYGGGTVVLWDLGTWTPEGDARAAYRKGHLAFELHGRKLQGRWSLVRMGGRAGEEERENWLLIKSDDPHARTSGDITAQRPESVKTGRRLLQVAQEQGGSPAQQKKAARADGPAAAKVTGPAAAAATRATRAGTSSAAARATARSRATRATATRATATRATATRATATRATATRATATRATATRATRGAAMALRRGRAALPAFVSPQLCTLVSEAPAGEEWLHEIKFDGFRMQARVDRGQATLFSRNRKPWSAKLPTLLEELAKLPCETALLDGEVILPTRAGGSSFEAFRDAIGTAAESRTVFQLFDLLHLDGEDLRALPLHERKRRLAELLERAHQPRLRYTDHVAGRGASFFTAACRHRLEGSIAKRADAPYRPGRGPDWCKIRCGMRQEFVVVGYTPSTTGDAAIGSLVLAVNDAQGHLSYAGRVGTGFSDTQREELRARLARSRLAQPPLDAPRESDLRDAVWSRPELVCDVSFTEWTSAGRLRHPSFQGLRDDKGPEEVVRETAVRASATKARSRSLAATRASPARSAPGKRTPRAKGGGASGARAKATGRSAASVPGTAAARGAAAPARDTAAPARDAAGAELVQGVRVTHPDRILDPEAGLTKVELARYYAQVAPLLLPHARLRPLALVRCPDGTGGSCFFQKHVLQGELAGIDVVPVQEKEAAAPKEYMSVASAAGLVTLVQHGVIELHLWGSRSDDLERPDRVVFDLDPAPDVAFPAVMQAARDARAQLAALGLESFAMTTGGKGLHVVVPVRRALDYDGVKAFTHAFSESMATREPHRFLTKASKASRTGRIFIDWLRNGRGATAVCPYGVRARAGAPVAVPVRWEELRAGFAPAAFRVRTIGKRLAEAGRRDPWSGYAAAGRQALTRAALRTLGL